jgi:hypothetical protein
MRLTGVSGPARSVWPSSAGASTSLDRWAAYDNAEFAKDVLRTVR